jgi:hypothetical protein
MSLAATFGMLMPRHRAVNQTQRRRSHGVRPAEAFAAEQLAELYDAIVPREADVAAVAHAIVNVVGGAFRQAAFRLQSIRRRSEPR